MAFIFPINRIQVLKVAIMQRILRKHLSQWLTNREIELFWTTDGQVDRDKLTSKPGFEPGLEPGLQLGLF